MTGLKKTRRRPWRPGGGEFAPPSGPYAAQSNLRNRFMREAFAIEPELKRSLQALYDDSLRGKPDWLETSFQGNLAVPTAKAVEVACALLASWAKKRGLGQDWCVDWILRERFLPQWALERGQIGVTTVVWRGPRPLARSPFGVVDCYDPTEETQKSFRTRLRASLEAALPVFCDRVEQEAVATGYVRTKERRQPAHFRWLAAYQVCRCSKAAIAKALNVRLYAVQHAVAALANEIGLKPRPHTTNKRISRKSLLEILKRNTN
jgi:hypothetical protein